MFHVWYEWLWHKVEGVDIQRQLIQDEVTLFNVEVQKRCSKVKKGASFWDGMGCFW